ncbi:MAG: 4a-hydroxytetrahydrobiopterin dehydratase [Pseudomonadota bacterium]
MQDAVYTEARIQAELEATLPDWQYVEGKLCRTYQANGWRASVMLFNAIAHLAEAAWHHPEVEVAWGQVTVHLVTHSADGVTAKDFALAHQIERWVTWQPEPESALEGAPTEGSWQYRA